MSSQLNDDSKASVSAPVFPHRGRVRFEARRAFEDEVHGVDEWASADERMQKSAFIANRSAVGVRLPVDF